jgi:hypothetical protein
MDYLVADVSPRGSFKGEKAYGNRTQRTSRLIAHLVTMSKYRESIERMSQEYEKADRIDSDMSERTSIFSEVMRYREENGRRYHGYKDGSYLLVSLK